MTDTSPKPATADNQKLIHVAFPQKATAAFITALAVGIFLLGAPTVFRSYFALNGLHANVVLCIGAAILLAAFGGQATLRFGPVVGAGVVAIAGGLLWFLQQQVDTNFLQGKISNYDYSRYKNIEIANRNAFLGAPKLNALNPSRSSYEFIAFKKNIEDSTIEVRLTTVDNREVVLFVNVDEVEWAFGNNRRLEWEFREQSIDGARRMALFEKYRNKVVSEERSAALNRPSKVAREASGIFITPAQAQEGAPLRAEDVQILIDHLKSDDTTLRRVSRQTLSDTPLGTVPLLIKAFNEQFDNYRIRLGISVVMAQRLRNKPGSAQMVSGVLSDADLQRWLTAAGDADKTVRAYATEFLSALGDPRVSKLAINRASAEQNDAAKYNLLKSAQPGFSKLTDSEQKSLVPVLTLTGDGANQRTKALIGQIK